ncbi:MAG: DNA polymerase I, partial [Deltaproteobacteria bacterium]|nr:DNA polymerase I [Deltaproteobacteria bacterium]
IPGVPGIGIKTAVELIQKFGSLEALLLRVEEIEKTKRKENLKKHADAARLSKELFLIHCAVDIDVSLEAFSRKEIDRKALLELFKKLEFYGLIKRLSLRDRETAPPLAEREVVRDCDSLERWREEIIEGGIVSIDTETTGLDAMRVLLVGISLCIPQKKKLKSAYIPIGHKGPDAGQQLDLAQIRELLGSVISDPRISKIGQNAKYDILVLRRHGLPMEGLAFDTMVSSYLLNPEGKHNLDDLALEYMNYHTTSYSDLVPRGSTFADVSVDAGADYSCQDAEVTYSLFKIFESLLEREGLGLLFRDVENPLVSVLAAMEYKGVKIDVPFLKAFSAEIASGLAVLEEKIYASAGEQFNINSNRQLSTLLFEKLRLPVLKSTKTGYSTDTDVLTQLKQKHPLPGLILEYRELAKLKSTYVDPIPKLVHPETGRIHTSYNQTMTATGRLSSSEPNLQNIPLRTERGRRLREAFIAEKGSLLISADYSQIELRLLAHLSEDPALMEAFQQGEDIHSRTASEVFGVPSGAVTPEMRRMAKVINFGILYGMSASRLSRDLDIPKKEAESFIERYFSRFSKVRAYLDGSIEQARKTGAVTTILNRRRYLPDIQSSSPMLRMNAERMAMNMPIQGSAADLIKIAMVRIHEELYRQRLPAEMIMQVHDELILEADEQMASEAAEILREQMEGAVALKVPLKVEVRSGKNWRALSHQ